MKVLLAVILIGLFVLPAMAQEPEAKKAKQKTMTVTQKLVAQFEALNLTEVQTDAVKTATDQYDAAIAELADSGFTKAVLKKRAELAKAARKEGLKAKELADKVAAGLTEAENGLFAKSDLALKDLHKSIAGLLTDAQMELLPQQSKKRLANALKGEGQQGKKGNKDKKKKKMKAEEAGSTEKAAE